MGTPRALERQWASAVQSKLTSIERTVRMWMTNSAAVSRATPHRPLFGGCSLLRPGARISGSPRL